VHTTTPSRFAIRETFAQRALRYEN